MLVKLTKKVKFKNREPFELKKSTRLQDRIEKVYKEYAKKRKGLHNGKIFIATDVSNKGGQYTLELSTTDFKTLVYARVTNKLPLHAIFSSVLLRTKDGYYVTIIDKDDRLNLFGGMATAEDFENNVYEPLNCLERELDEEFCLDLNDEKLITNCEARFLSLPDGMDNNSESIGVIYVADVNLTQKALEKHFKENKENTDGEVDSLVFNGEDGFKELSKVVESRSYILEVIKILEKE